MASPVQWTIDHFWTQLQRLKGLAGQLRDELLEDRAQLTRLWSSTRRDPDPRRRAANQALLRPLIHRNSELRLSYLKPVTDKFNAAVAASSKVLRDAGYTTPELSGLGVVFALAPLAAVTIVVAALALAATAIVLTAAQRRHTAAVARVLEDAQTTPEQKQAILRDLKDEQKAAAPGLNPLGFDFGQLIPLAGIVAVIVLGPDLLRTFGSRRAAA